MAQIGSIRRILLRDLRSLREELAAYQDERMIWVLPPGLKNSAGTLAMHLVGNLRHFIGATLGGSGYVRDREFEFAGRDIPRMVLDEGIDSAIREVDAAMGRLSATEIEKTYPLEVGGQRFPTGLFLTHLVVHFGYHLGQIDYHRRIVTGNSEGIGAQSLAELGD